MKTIHLKFAGLTMVVALLASSCHNSDTQGSNLSANGTKTDSIRANSARDSVAAIRNANNPNASNSATPHNWSLIITPNTTKSYLDSVTSMWKKENIDITISKFKCDDKGKLVKIKGSININTKSGNHAEGEFKSENLASIQIKVDDSPNVSIKED